MKFRQNHCIHLFKLCSRKIFQRRQKFVLRRNHFPRSLRNHIFRSDVIAHDDRNAITQCLDHGVSKGLIPHTGLNQDIGMIHDAFQLCVIISFMLPDVRGIFRWFKEHVQFEVLSFFP